MSPKCRYRPLPPQTEGCCNAEEHSNGEEGRTWHQLIVLQGQSFDFDSVGGGALSAVKSAHSIPLPGVVLSRLHPRPHVETVNSLL